MKNFLLATRPKTLLVGIIPPLMSFSFYSTQSDNLPWTILICCLLSALGIQIATNLFNDLIDFKKGADSFRHGPTRVTASGLVPEQTVRLWALFSLGAAAIFSLPLIQTGGDLDFTTWVTFALSHLWLYGRTISPGLYRIRRTLCFFILWIIFCDWFLFSFCREHTSGSPDYGLYIWTSHNHTHLCKQPSGSRAGC